MARQAGSSNGRIAYANFPGESDHACSVPILWQRERDPHHSAVQVISLLHLTLRRELLA